MIITDNDIKSINTALLSLQDEIASLKKQLASLEGKAKSIQNVTNYNKQKTNNMLSIDAGILREEMADERGRKGYPYGVNTDRSYLLQLYEDKISRWGNRTSGLSEYGDNLVRSGDPKKPEQECNEVDGCQVWNDVHNAVAVGKGTIAGQSNTMVLGTYNVHDEDLKEGEERAYHALVVGNGTGTKEDERSNAFAVDQNGDIRVRGEIYYGCEPDSSGGKTIGDNIEAINQTIANLGSTYLRLSGGHMMDGAYIIIPDQKEDDEDEFEPALLEVGKIKLTDSVITVNPNYDSYAALKMGNVSVTSEDSALTLEADGVYVGSDLNVNGGLNAYSSVYVGGNINCDNDVTASGGKFTGSLVIPTSAPSSYEKGAIWVV